jgi:hypothetical protein
MNDTLRGQLTEGALPNLLQYLALNQASGCLLLRHPQGAQGQLYFAEGRVVHISHGAHRDLNALAALLAWRDGQFIFRAGVAPPTHSLKMTLDTLLLEAAYHADTAYRGRNGLFSDSTVLVPKSMTEGDQKVALTLRALQLLRHLNGTDSLGEVWPRSGLTRADAFFAAEELYQQALVQPLTSRATPPGFLRDLSRVVVNLMGPMGEIVVEDALYDLGLDADAVPMGSVDELLAELREQFQRRDWQRYFDQQALALKRHYGIG